MSTIAGSHGSGLSADESRNLGWISCPHCEAACRMKTPLPGTELRCSRCGSTVVSPAGKKTFQPALAFSLAGLFSLFLANTNPILTFDVAGREQQGFMITGVEELFRQGYWPIAMLVFFAAILAPTLYLASVAYVSTACSLRIRIPWVRQLYHLSELMESWNLIPVYAIATMVSVVKLKMIGGVTWNFGARWVLAVAVATLFTQQFFDKKMVNRRLQAGLRILEVAKRISILSKENPLLVPKVARMKSRLFQGFGDSGAKP